MVSQSAVSQENNEFFDRWIYRCNFCREIGVRYLYGEKLREVPEEHLSIMLGACIERYRNPFMVVIAIMRLIYELTKESFLDRPMYSIRHGWRRIRTKFVLMQVLNFLARGYANDHDTFVRVVMDILTAREQIPVWNAWNEPSNQGNACVDSIVSVKGEGNMQDPEPEVNQNEDENPIQIAYGNAYDDDQSDDEWLDDEEHSEMVPLEDNVPVVGVAPQMQPNVIFMDAAALKECQNNAIMGCDEEKQYLRSLDIIVPGPSFRDIDAMDPLAWADIVRENFGLNVRVEYVPFDKLPWLETSMRRSGLSKGDYYIVKYAVYFSQLIPNLQVDCATPGVMELYEAEMARVRTREGFMRILGGVNS